LSDALILCDQIDELLTITPGDRRVALWSIQHAANSVEIAAVVAAVKMVVTTPALIVTTDGFERATTQDGATMMAYQRWSSSVL
jgi:hypothetical protein